VGVPILAASRTFVVTVSGSAERFSVNSCVKFVILPAACPSFRATVFKRGSCFTDRFFAGIGFLKRSVFKLRITCIPDSFDKNEVPAKKGRDSLQMIIASRRKLRSTTLMVAVLVILLVLVRTLTTLLRLVLAGLAALLALSVLP
jgi:hypothetical protein